jgi:hypothetical protein
MQSDPQAITVTQCLRFVLGILLIGSAIAVTFL